MIERIMANEPNLIDTGDAIARHLLKRSLEKGHANDGELRIYLFSTGELDINSVDAIISEYEKISTI